MEKVLFKYNPQQMAKEELEATFVGREALFNSLISGLKNEASKKHHQHIILKGPRGIGKTHILSMVYFKVKEDGTLSSNWIPVQFAEEEFGIIDLKGLFLRILEELIKEKDDSILSEFMKSLKLEDDYTTVYSFLKDYLKGVKKSVLIIVDNIEIILSRLSKLEANMLRNILMNEPYLLIYGGAITLFKEILLASQPFYQLFKIEEVGELKEDEFERLLQLRFRLDGREDFLKRSPATTFSSRLKALYRLTGGNPRLLLILYQFLTLGELKEVLFYLNHILDEHSQYFLDKIKMLTNQQQAIIDAIAKSELLITPKEMAEKTGIKINIVTAQVSKLLDMGYLAPLKLSHPRNITCYELGERIFRIWYQMRTGGRHRRRIQFLITFLQIWYEEKELKREIRTIEKECSLLITAGRAEEAETIKEQAGYFREALKGLVKNKEKGAEQLQGAWKKIDTGQFDNAITILDEIVMDKTITDTDIISGTWLAMGYAYSNKREYDKAIESYRQAIIKFSQAKVEEEEIEEFGKGLVDMFKYILKLKRYEDANKIFCLCETKLPKDMLGLLYPIKVAIDYLITGNKTLIERQPIEFRQTIEDILKERRDGGAESALLKT